MGAATKMGLASTSLLFEWGDKRIILFHGFTRVVEEFNGNTLNFFVHL
jgi:hypothetical protein